MNPNTTMQDLFQRGLAHVQIDNGVGYIDKTGSLVIQPDYDCAYGFSEGLALALRVPDDDFFIDKKWKCYFKI